MRVVALTGAVKPWAPYAIRIECVAELLLMTDNVLDSNLPNDGVPGLFDKAFAEIVKFPSVRVPVIVSDDVALVATVCQVAPPSMLASMMMSAFAKRAPPENANAAISDGAQSVRIFRMMKPF